ncbi:hypothetical protein LU631_14775 [Erwinia tracheiphila]|uniref:SDR family oxidoreductase n=1 Tax=Erwinia tracheiphila TaxID=65700 RepID=A0A0M2K6R3_9GAMM|nr:hypothetical protein [Erwinia tracheiphila]KKF34619.1 hypothetical protein SY86_02820 [Erwinia tracheiphila]UIA86292.1 hypothetical protein LU631_14775 [Erwinia tracheiphila]UIA94609.1 hypothetical protein LU633_12985 [Erwinia tracheiphila]
MAQQRSQNDRWFAPWPALANRNIRANVISPGPIETSMMHLLKKDKVQMMIGGMPVGKQAIIMK